MAKVPIGAHQQESPHDRRTFRERTVLLGSFTAHDLVPPEDDETATHSAALQDFLLEDCSRITTSRGRRWCLAPGPRARTLDDLSTRDRLLAAARSASDIGEDPARAWTERLLLGADRPLAEQSFDELYTGLTVVGWFKEAPRARDQLARDGVVLPDPDDIEHAIGRARLLQPLCALADAKFTGRTDELAWLSAHLGEAPDNNRPDSADPEKWQRGDAPGSWAFVHGPGGVGKSTLVARFVLDRIDGYGRVAHGFAADDGRPQAAADVAAADRGNAGGRPPADVGAPDDDGRQSAQGLRPMPCLYLTFDRHDLVAERPLTLVAEAVRQLGLLFPDLAGRTEELKRELEITLAADRLTRSEDGHFSPRAAHQRDELTLIDAFAALVTSVTGGTTQLWLLALDAFEQVQRSGPVAVQRLLNFLSLLHLAHPGLRVLAAGRAPVEAAPFRCLPLEGFDPATARAFLHRELTDSAEDALPAESGRELEAIMHIVGTSPLNLKLAAALVRRAGTQVLGDRRLRSELLLQLGAETVQGVLYRRLLDHLHDPDLRRIASPGLVVRTLTPGVIREVLARPCGLGHVDEERARRLFDDFRAEATLVEEVPGRDAVVHRGDVRRAMLPLLRRDQRSVVDRIHRKAVGYYALLHAGNDLVESRVEELYHRLSLAQSTQTLDKRWIDAAGALLESAMEELPARAQVYLTERLGNSATAELRAMADDETWERQATRVGKALLAADNPAEVTEVLAEREHLVPDNLDLTLLSMRSMLALRRPADAYELVDRALELAAESADPVVFVDLALLGARTCEDLGRFDDALDLLTQARRVAERPGMAIRLLSVAAAQLRIHRRGGSVDTAEAVSLRADTLVRVRNLGSKAYRRHPLLIRELAAEIGDEMPELVSYTARSLGVGGTEGPDDVLLGSLTGEVVTTPSTERTADAPDTGGQTVAARDRDPDGPAVSPGSVRVSSVSVSSVSRGYAVGSYLDSHPDGAAPWNRALVDSYRHEVDRPYTRDAVVVIPGFAGSTLVDEESDEVVWGSTFNHVMNLMRQTRRSNGLAVTEEERQGQGGRLRPAELLQGPAWLPLIGGLSPYGRLVNGVRSVVVHGDAALEFPYDWRLSVGTSARRLAEAALRHLARWREHAAHQASARHGPADGSKLVLIAHSMGGLVAQAALAAYPELSRATRDVITIGTPFRGTPQVMQLLASRRSRLQRNALSNPLGEAVGTMPSLYDLLPDTPCVLTDSGGLRRLTPRDVQAVGGDDALAEAALAARRSLAAATGRLPRMHAIVGTSQPTPQSMAIEDGAVRLFRHVPRLRDDGTPVRDARGLPVLVDEGGDGLVPKWCALPTDPATYLPVVGHHSSLPASATVVNMVQEILTGKFDRRTSLEGPFGAPEPAGGVASLAPSFGISAPSEVVPGQEWSLTVTGAHPAAVACRLLRAETGEVTARMRLTSAAGDPGTLTARAVVSTPGFYQVVAQAGGLSATALVVAVDCPTGD
ncbi:lipase/acyltransferase domain-containing protein [Streptomyces sp. DSM 40750]|uniref:lipase/acyltransferase domain-containing protein n=2 Tax=Streptomyces sp. DSM 40750 TaxID=2801030 RepID=UPI00214B8305|nr:hypothetical protein [Streptomyces sp. DSM 40750]UUU27369.1 hypothetical protein JIX55_48130 [Streptomyces sp. DSM 40750]